MKSAPTFDVVSQYSSCDTGLCPARYCNMVINSGSALCDRYTLLLHVNNVFRFVSPLAPSYAGFVSLMKK